MKKKTEQIDEEPLYSKEQFLNSKTIALPKDAVQAILKDGQLYTKKQAAELITEFFKRKV